MLSIFCFLFLIRTRQECLCQGPNRNLHSGQQLLRSKGIELLHLRPQNRVAETSSFDALIKIKHTWFYLTLRYIKGMRHSFTKVNCAEWELWTAAGMHSASSVVAAKGLSQICVDLVKWRVLWAGCCKALTSKCIVSHLWWGQKANLCWFRLPPPIWKYGSKLLDQSRWFLSFPWFFMMPHLEPWGAATKDQHAQVDSWR